jgi:hypothetical protein
VVRLDEKKKTGRPLKLTDARFGRMLALIREGYTNSAACRVEGIDYTTWGPVFAKKRNGEFS